MNMNSPPSKASSCCPLAISGFSDEDGDPDSQFYVLAQQLKAMGHPARLKIVAHLLDVKPCCCVDICRQLPLAQSTISQHLKILVEAGILSTRRQGNCSNFFVVHEALNNLQIQLARLGVLPLDLGEKLHQDAPAFQTKE